MAVDCLECLCLSSCTLTSLIKGEGNISDIGEGQLTESCLYSYPGIGEWPIDYRECAR
jgi:hypothetical protein